MWSVSVALLNRVGLERVDADWRSTSQSDAAIICHMAKDTFKKLSPLSPARLEEHEWQLRAKEQKKTKKAKAKPKVKR
jgi:hypothetical protein